MHQLMIDSLLPDNRQMSREAAERYAVPSARKEREDPPRSRFLTSRPVMQH